MKFILWCFIFGVFFVQCHSEFQGRFHDSHRSIKEDSFYLYTFDEFINITVEDNSTSVELTSVQFLPVDRKQRPVAGPVVNFIANSTLILLDPWNTLTPKGYQCSKCNPYTNVTNEDGFYLLLLSVWTFSPSLYYQIKLWPYDLSLYIALDPGTVPFLPFAPTFVIPFESMEENKGFLDSLFLENLAIFIASYVVFMFILFYIIRFQYLYQ